MSSYVFMKVLESTAHRYDRGMQLLSRGRIEEVYSRVADLASSPKGRILDIGCGTGGVSLACAARGCTVTGIDVDAEMLEVARAKAARAPTTGSVEWLQLAAAEIEDRFQPSSFDAVTACLVFSELSPDQQAYALRIARSRLRPGGKVVLADEVAPLTLVGRMLYRLGRLPMELVTYLLTQTTTHAVSGLGDQLRVADFVEAREERPWASFAIIAAQRPLDDV
jgi:demethylmenaquinone methyltransferase/2-methoxy-6-polyprenyl-1,4-benzoquinol methylase